MIERTIEDIAEALGPHAERPGAVAYFSEPVVQSAQVSHQHQT